MKNKLIVANWKNHPDSLTAVEEIIDSVGTYLSLTRDKKPSLVFCPPFVFIEEVGEALKAPPFLYRVELGAQDISMDDNGSMTGEISGPMLKRLEVNYVIIGHSERRWRLGESDETVNKKLKSALRNDIIPIVCIGERERDKDFKLFLKNQVRKTFEGLSSEEIKKCIIAYEPVWAISSNPGARPDTPESTLESIKIIKDTLIGNWKLEVEDLSKILYGGSVNSQNIFDFLGKKEIAGVLVGSASVNKDEFIKMLAIASDAT